MNVKLNPCSFSSLTLGVYLQRWTASSALVLLAACSATSESDGGTSGTGSESDGSGTNEDAGGRGDGAENNTAGNEDGEANCEANLESIRQTIFASSCAGASCHGGDSPQAGLDLDQDVEGLEAELVGQMAGSCEEWMLVKPGDPDASFLFNKLGSDPSCGVRMPVGGALSASQIACVEQWISNLQGMDCETCGEEMCVDLETDAKHCGMCNNACPEGIACVAGKCDCRGEQEVCEGECVDTQSNPEHCGSCGNACEEGLVCIGGMCASSCEDGLTDCDGACVDLQNDDLHCGSCGNECDADKSCREGECQCGESDISFATQVVPIFEASCNASGCHGGNRPKAGLGLTAARAYAELVDSKSSQCDDRARVAPGDSGNSYLMHKLDGVNLCSGGQMPKGDSPLTLDQRKIISDWICQGALEN